ncbi:hypothetical protein [Cupriavidus sp. AcVe19-6a]|uniref:hypothetical protein n=1 Tax=Cupriavidus sp. AcVe19-6a TaxID=2821358 RepID=UPI001AEA82FB|nr:hypothetical protein [Cupriavidus sp. AcVe19-6a]MBP0639964.1 hypothetical protein [Cupriavidus sp. AcVe19-6a]
MTSNTELQPTPINDQQATQEPSIHVIPQLIPSGRFIIDQDRRKVAEMFQPGDSPAETETIKSRIVRSFNALPDLVGVLMRADKEGGLWQALFNEGIGDAFNAASKASPMPSLRH